MKVREMELEGIIGRYLVFGEGNYGVKFSRFMMWWNKSELIKNEMIKN